MSYPAIQIISPDKPAALELTCVQLGSDELSEELRRERAGVHHQKYGLTVSARNWKHARVWNLNINVCSKAFIESIRPYFLAGSFYLYPDVDNTAVKYIVYWEDEEFHPVYISPNKYSLKATWKETAIGSDEPAFVQPTGDQSISGNLTVDGDLTVTGTLNASFLESGGTNINEMFADINHTHSFTATTDSGHTHEAPQITQGTFAAGNFAFQGNLSVAETLTAKDIYVNPDGTEATAGIMFCGTTESGSPPRMYWDEPNQRNQINRNTFVQGVVDSLGYKTSGVLLDDIYYKQGLAGAIPAGAIVGGIFDDTISFTFNNSVNVDNILFMNYQSGPFGYMYWSGTSALFKHDSGGWNFNDTGVGKPVTFEQGIDCNGPILSGGVDISTLWGSGGTGGSGVTVHSELTGLLENDHPQYRLTADTINFSEIGTTGHTHDASDITGGTLNIDGSVFTDSNLYVGYAGGASTNPSVYWYNTGGTNMAHQLYHQSSGDKLLRLHTKDFAGNDNYQLMVWDRESDNVGINTDTPSYDLDVNGAGRFTSNLNVGGQLNAGTLSATTTIHSDASVTADGVMVATNYRCYDNYFVNYNGSAGSNNIYWHNGDADTTYAYLRYTTSTSAFTLSNTLNVNGGLTSTGTITGSTIQASSALSCNGQITALGSVYAVGGYSGITKEKSVTILEPQTNDEVTLMKTKRAITVSETDAVVRGTSPSVTWFIRFASDRSSGSPTTMNNGTANSTTTGNNDNTMVDSTIPAGNWVWLDVTATGGTSVDEFSIQMTYKED